MVDAVLLFHGFNVSKKNMLGNKCVKDEEKSAEAPETFLAALGDSLKGKEGADVGLVDILKAHILKAAPAQNAVAQAKDAIIKLAGARAAPHNSEGANG